MLDLKVSRYAVHNPSVGFTVKKQGELLTDVKTNQDSTHIDNIQAIYGSPISRYIIKIIFYFLQSIKCFINIVNHFQCFVGNR